MYQLITKAEDLLKMFGPKKRVKEAYIQAIIIGSKQSIDNNKEKVNEWKEQIKECEKALDLLKYGKWQIS